VKPQQQNDSSLPPSLSPSLLTRLEGGLALPDGFLQIDGPEQPVLHHPDGHLREGGREGGVIEPVVVPFHCWDLWKEGWREGGREGERAYLNEGCRDNLRLQVGPFPARGLEALL